MSWIWLTSHSLLTSDLNDHSATECQGLTMLYLPPETGASSSSSSRIPPTTLLPRSTSSTNHLDLSSLKAEPKKKILTKVIYWESALRRSKRGQAKKLSKDMFSVENCGCLVLQEALECQDSSRPCSKEGAWKDYQLIIGCWLPKWENIPNKAVSPSQRMKAAISNQHSQLWGTFLFLPWGNHFTPIKLLSIAWKHFQ